MFDLAQNRGRTWIFSALFWGSCGSRGCWGYISSRYCAAHRKEQRLHGSGNSKSLSNFACHTSRIAKESATTVSPSTNAGTYLIGFNLSNSAIN
jgi:hypothetical protein